MKDCITNATLVLQRGNESLWLRGNTYMTLSASGCTDYPIRYHDGRVGYDRPEVLSAAFRRMVRTELNRAFHAEVR